MNFKDINNKKNIVLFGAGYIAEKTFKNINKELVKGIVDNSLNLQGSKRKKILNLTVKSAISINIETDFVIICSTAIDAISEQLIKMGCVENSGFCASPLLENYIAIEKLEKLDKSFLFSSGSAPSDVFGGGLYKVNVSLGKMNYKRLYSGFTFGILRYNDRILFIDTDRGVMELKSNEQIVKVADLPKDSRAHGFSYNEEHDKFYVSCSNLDSVLEYDTNFELLREFKLSNKKDLTSVAQHHTNDNVSVGNSVYASMFSSTGNWKTGMFDGVVAEFDLITGERLKDVISGLYMPHNVSYHNGNIAVLDSLNGHLMADNGEISGTFPGFTRGLDFDGQFFYVGQSKNRNYSKVVGRSNNISVDCSIIVFDPIRKVSRSFQFPIEIGEIHSIFLLN